jgi:SET domain-containing protein
MVYEIKDAGKFGKGAFALRDIKKGESLANFSGEELKRQEIHNRIIAGQENADDPLQIDDDLFLDIDNDAYFFNHNCEPNAGIRGRCELIAIKDIKKGEEITFDYATTVGVNIENWIMECACGATNCRKVIGNILTVPKDKIDEYYKAGALQNYIRRQLKEKDEV